MRFDSASESKGKKRNKYNASEAGPRSEERIKNIKEKTIINYFNRLNYLEIMKKYLLFATAALALASCTNESYLGTAEELATAKGEQPISFGFNVPTPTRAEGAAAATKLNNQFIVWGEKGETDGTAAVTDGSTAKQRVFPNYKVTYGTNTAYTSTSNTKDWEYVGLSYTASGDQDFVKMAGTKVTTDVQTIKYWDYNADSYTFTAVSAKPTDISAGQVTINKLTSGTTVYDKGYEVDVTADADLNSLYFADRVNIEKTATYDRTQPNKYGGNVTFTFRNGQSQVRVGMYETIPGYEVKVTKFYYAAAANPGAGSTGFDAMTDNSTTNFVANVPNTATGGVAGKFTVKYYAKNAVNDAAGISNHPTISFAPTTAADTKTYITLGNQITAATKLGETSTAATYDKADSNGDGVKDFTTFFPQESNDKNLKLKIDYTLKNTVTGETIDISGKTAEIPAQYLQWKPNFKYTYLFKITDDELYPITFDAVVVEAENGQAEYITTVSEPSITTFGAVYVYDSEADATKFSSYQTGEDEYQAQTAPDRLDIFATIMDGSDVVDFTLGTNVNVYKATTTDATNFPITEASVAESLAETSVGTKQITTELLNGDGSSCFSAAPTKVDAVPGEDGIDESIKALKLTGVKATTTTTALVVEYIKTAATYYTETVSIADQTELTTYLATGKLYTNDTGTTEASATFDGSATYYRRTAVKSVGKYAYKVIRVQ